jgi:hypothetical protein
MSLFETSFAIVKVLQNSMLHLQQSKQISHRESLHDKIWTSLSWCQATIGARDQFFFLLEIFLRQFQACYFMAPSLTSGRVCSLLLLLGLASTVPLGSEYRGTQEYILLFQFFRLPQPGGPGPRIYISQRQGGPVIPPGTGSLPQKSNYPQSRNTIIQGDVNFSSL